MIKITGSSIKEQLLITELKNRGFEAGSSLVESEIPKKFEDSAEATEFFGDVLDRLKSKALMDWAKITDQNYSTGSVSKLKAAIKAYNEFIDELEKAV